MVIDRTRREPLAPLSYEVPSHAPTAQMMGEAFETITELVKAQSETMGAKKDLPPTKPRDGVSEAEAQWSDIYYNGYLTLDLKQPHARQLKMHIEKASPEEKKTNRWLQRFRLLCEVNSVCQFVYVEELAQGDHIQRYKIPHAVFRYIAAYMASLADSKETDLAALRKTLADTFASGEFAFQPGIAYLSSAMAAAWLTSGRVSHIMGAEVSSSMAKSLGAHILDIVKSSIQSVNITDQGNALETVLTGFLGMPTAEYGQFSQGITGQSNFILKANDLLSVYTMSLLLASSKALFKAGGEEAEKEAAPDQYVVQMLAVLSVRAMQLTRRCELARQGTKANVTVSAFMAGAQDKNGASMAQMEHAASSAVVAAADLKKTPKTVPLPKGMTSRLYDAAQHASWLARCLASQRIAEKEAFINLLDLLQDAGITDVRMPSGVKKADLDARFKEAAGILFGGEVLTRGWEQLAEGPSSFISNFVMQASGALDPEAAAKLADGFQKMMGSTFILTIEAEAKKKENAAMAKLKRRARGKEARKERQSAKKRVKAQEEKIVEQAVREIDFETEDETEDGAAPEGGAAFPAESGEGDNEGAAPSCILPVNGV